jgi:hypothetical protein
LIHGENLDREAKPAPSPQSPHPLPPRLSDLPMAAPPPPAPSLPGLPPSHLSLRRWSPGRRGGERRQNLSGASVGGTSSGRLSPMSRSQSPLSFDGVPGGTAVKGNKNRGGAWVEEAGSRAAHRWEANRGRRRWCRESRWTVCPCSVPSRRGEDASSALGFLGARRKVSRL